MNYPKISIVTPSFNQAQYIEDTILSVISQDYPNLEYIIIDGGSTDGSVEIIKKYEQYLAYWISEPDNGHGHALNKGFAKSTGEIMAWINSDDKYYPYTFKTVAEIFTKFSDINWIHGKNSRFDKYGRLDDVQFSFINIYSFLLYNYKWIQQESVFWRRSLWDKSGAYINEKMSFMVDGELWSRFFLFDDIWHLNIVIGGFRSHDTNRSHFHIEKVYCEMEEVINIMKTKIDPRIKKSFTLLKRYIDQRERSEKYHESIFMNKLLKLLPQLIYTRVIRCLTPNKDLNLDFDIYDFRVLNFTEDEWKKSTHKFNLIKY